MTCTRAARPPIWPVWPDIRRQTESEEGGSKYGGPGYGTARPASALARGGPISADHRRHRGHPPAGAGYELTCQLARAYNNLAGPEEAGPLEKSVSLLESIADQGQEDPLWHYRLGYALFYLDREEEALPHFQRAAELDPQDPDAPEFIRQCQKYIAAKQCCPEVYGQEDWDTVDQHIHTYFGSSENVFHEIVSPDIHVDIYIIPPSPERNYYILMTHGMGAHAMNVPGGSGRPEAGAG